MAKLNIKEVARRANVSTATISRVFNNKNNVSEKTKTKVNAIIQKENYCPNFYAKGLSAGKTAFIGCIVPNIANTYFSILLREIVKTAENKNYFVFSYDYAANAAKERELVQSFIEKGITQLIISSVDIEQNFSFYNEHIEGGKKIIILNRNYYAKLTEHLFPYFAVNVNKGIDFAVDYLRQKKVKKLAYIKADLSYGEPLYLLNRIQNALKKNNIMLPGKNIFSTKTNVDFKRQYLNEKLEDIIETIDAIITPEDIIAFSILSTFNKTIKDNKIDLLSLTRNKIHDYFDKSFPSVEHPIKKLASSSINALIKWSEENIKPKSCEYTPRLIT
ncbi:MAG TPA: LacI family DNA-binding transcriptional regulator [Spirochaetota bacterium]|nr:LacI family DNA-binding transcriptional regulator [Spirochaetota bacterium]